VHHIRRPKTPLCRAHRGGSIETLNSFLNLASRNDFVLIVAWLLAALRLGGPYPLLAISGEQGSALPHAVTATALASMAGRLIPGTRSTAKASNGVQANAINGLR
jgi:hypothetical protein